MKIGIEFIAEERKRQIEVGGYDEEQDDTYVNNELSLAAACYAILEKERKKPTIYNSKVVSIIHLIWPWPSWYFKPTPDDRIKELAKAGALIAAEIDRLQRLNNK